MSDDMGDDELLYRQIHPNWFEDGLPTSQGFRPTGKDDGKLSVDRSTVFTAEESFLLHHDDKGLATAGTWGLTVAEFAAEDVGCRPDPLERSYTEPANPAHAVADFSLHGGGKCKLIGKRLRNVAVARGRVHPRS